MSDHPLSSMPDSQHTELVDQILKSFEERLGIRITAWERVTK